MSESDQPPKLKIDEIIAIFEGNRYPRSEAQIQLLKDGLDNLNRQLLFSATLQQDLSKYILPMFNNQRNDEIMRLCSKCIVSAFKTDKKIGVEPSDFPFSTVIKYVKSNWYTKETKKELLEIIFSIVNIKNSDSKNQIAEIANSDSNDIDIFFSYYDAFEDSSKISCLKCIKNIVENRVFDRFVIFLPNLLKIALSNENKQSETLYKMAIQTFVIMSRYYLDKGLLSNDIRDNQFDPKSYCEMLCKLTKNELSKFSGLVYLDVFINSIRLCVQTFNYTIPLVQQFLQNIDISAFFENIEDTPVIQAAIELILALTPYPSDKLTYISPTKFIFFFSDAFQNRDPSYFFNLKESIQKTIPYICKIYYTNISLSLLCIQALTIFANTDNISIILSKPVVYMMHFHLADYNYTPYILSIISQCMKLEENRELIIKSRLIERLSILIEENRRNRPQDEDELYNFYSKTMKEHNYDPQKCKIEIDFGKMDIKELVSKIENNQLSQFDLLQIYYQSPDQNRNCFRRIKKMINKENHFDQIEDKAQVIVNFLLQMLADMPIPILCSDPYYGKYDSMLDDEITFVNENGSSEKKVSLNSILSEYNGNGDRPDMNDLLADDRNKQISGLFNLDEILTHDNPYLYQILKRELSYSKNQQYKINDIVINDPEQFIINILPKMIDLKINENLDKCVDLGKMIHEKFQIEIEDLSAKEEPSKKIICKLILMKNQEVIQVILDVLSYIYERDQMHTINFINQQFLDNILAQTKYLFLSMELYSPCSQLMVKYPFLFRINERHFLMQLLVKEPFMAKELFLKEFYPHHERKKQAPHAQVKFVINRDNIFKEGIHILERFAKYRAFLDIKFQNEVGFGEGPTREFFNLMSREFCEKRHRLWRRTIYSRDEKEIECEDEDKSLQNLYVYNEQGLFPYATANSQYMHALGLFIAKAIQMEQIIDMPFNPAFFDIAAGREVNIADVDIQIAKSISYGYFDGLTFVCNVEGKDYDIVQNGKDIDVTEDNFDIYKKALKDFICGKHVKKKIDCFVKGFSEVLDPIILKMFTGKEILTILNGSSEILNAETMEKYIKFEKGYSPEEIQNFIDVTTSLDLEEQKYFIQFVTGYSNLPFGGLAALDPPITVAKKTDEEIEKLPTAATCFNRLKLPSFSSKEDMEQKIKMAITECRESFDLS